MLSLDVFVLHLQQTMLPLDVSLQWHSSVNSYLCAQDLYGQCIMPQMALAFIGLTPFHRVQKVSISRPNPLPLALIMDLPASKALCTVPYKS
jgi:hypothetical protein